MDSKSQYFDAMYEESDDPWDYANRWYEKRKRQICMSVLPKMSFTHILEIGCANGFLSELLAERCQKLLCIDANPKAIQLAKLRLEDEPHVEFSQQRIPNQFPEGLFDLIVVSEILYYLTKTEVTECLDKIKISLSTDGVVLSCHWRHPIEGFELNGNSVHELLKNELNLHHSFSLTDPDFVLDVWTYHPASVAELEGLL